MIEGFVSAGDLKLRILRSEILDRPTCFISSPGWGWSVDFYVETLKDLGQWFNLVFIDTRGSGESTAPFSVNDYHYEQTAGDFEAIQKHLGVSKVWLFGHSLGGVLAMTYATQFPESVEGLLLVDTCANTKSNDYAMEVKKRKSSMQNTAWYPKAIQYGDWREVGGDEQFHEKFMGFLPFYYFDQENLAKVMDIYRKTTTRSHAWNGWIQSENCEVDILPKLNRVECSTLIIVGSDDFVCPPICSREIHSKITGSKLIELSNCGHFPWIEKEAAFYEAVKRFVG